MFLLLTLNLFHILVWCLYIASFEQLNESWFYFEEISLFFLTLEICKKLKAT